VKKVERKALEIYIDRHKYLMKSLSKQEIYDLANQTFEFRKIVLSVESKKLIDLVQTSIKNDLAYISKKCMSKK
jgi:hypothetical protein